MGSLCDSTRALSSDSHKAGSAGSSLPSAILNVQHDGNSVGQTGVFRRFFRLAQILAHHAQPEVTLPYR